MKLHSPRQDPYSNVEQTKRKLEKEGYTVSFKLSSDGNHIEDENGHEFGIKTVALDSIYRLVGHNNEADNKTLYALSTSSGVNGILEDGFGKYSSDSVISFLQRVKNQA